MEATFTLIDEGATLAIRTASAPGEGTWLDAEDLQSKLGWQLKPEGLCRGEICIPVRDRNGLVADGAIELGRLADCLGRPLALDADEGAAALGTAASDRGAALRSLEAPDFALPDLEGKLHRLSQHRGKKVLLIAYASW